MNYKSTHIVRVALAITFIWIGVLILRNPESWGGYLLPWAVKLLPFSIGQTLMATAVLDIIVGVLLLIDWYTWLAAAVAALHMALVLTVSGITDITVRDIAILGAALALAIETLPTILHKKSQTTNPKSQTIPKF